MAQPPSTFVVHSLYFFPSAFSLAQLFSNTFSANNIYRHLSPEFLSRDAFSSFIY